MKTAFEDRSHNDQDAAPFIHVTSNPADALDIDNCFTSGTQIATMRGRVPVEDLTDGDKVLTRDRGFQPVRWRGRRSIDLATASNADDFRPVLIRAGALGPAQPDRDMLVSPKLKILNINPNIMSESGDYESLVSAQSLVGQPGIEWSCETHVTYHHLLFERHEVILSDNLWSASYFLTRAAADTLMSSQAEDLAKVFSKLLDSPGCAVHTPARPSADIIPLTR